MKKLLLGISLSLLATTTFAADAVVEEAVIDVVPGFTWTGGYVGGQVGYAWGSGGAEQTDGPGFADTDPDGFIGGVYVGYNYQMPSNIVIGAELDVVYADVDGNGQVFEAPGIPAEAIANQELNWSGAARLRLGYAMDRFLPYIAGGIAFGDMDFGFASPTESATFSETFTGWTIGAGVEYAFTDNVVGRVEYRYTDFGSEIFDEDAEVDLSTNEVRFGIAYKF
jgi:outer membrane immunogenic protein